jgi:F-type H+-transporting ATPase subunit b
MNLSRGHKGRVSLVLFVALACIVGATGLGLASGGSEQDADHNGGRVLDLLYRFINFALLVIILFVVVRKSALKSFFSNRREEIAHKLEELGHEKESSEARYRELEQKLKEFEGKREEIIEQFRAEGLVQKERIISEAKQRATQILNQADMTIEREIQAARDRLKEELVDAATKKAEETISREIKTSDQDQLVDEFIERLGKLH